MKTRSTVLALLASLSLVATSASAAVLDETGYTRSIDLEVSGYTGSSTLSGFPVLVRLGPTVGGFRYADFASPDGGDLVFTDANGNVIPHEIDTWNTNGESLVWVKLPSMAKNTSFCAYWGRMPDAANDPTAVWSGYVGVWHMGEDSGNAIDATGHGYNGVPSGDLASGMVAYEDGAVGRARVNQNQFDGKAYLTLANSGSIALGTKFHVSGWVMVNGVQNNGPRFVSRKAVYTDTNGWECEFYKTPTAMKIRGASNSTVHQPTIPNIAEAWCFLSIVYNGTTATVYTNGVKSSSGSITAASDNSRAISFGCDSDGDETSLNGRYDEIRIAKTVPTADWALAEYRSMAVADFVKAQPVANLAEPRMFHVDAANGDDEADGLSWDTPLATIQRAIDLACTGDEILVADGTYAPIASDNLGVTIRSINGAAATIIDGGGTNRCASLGVDTNDVVKTTLVGFTLRNGRNMHGTGAKGGIVKDCIVTDNYAGRDYNLDFKGFGGGLFGCIATGCVVSNNAASNHGGGAYVSVLSRCVLSGNVAADDGGGACSSELSDCLIIGNEASNSPGGNSGGGARSCQLFRCTLSDNRAGPGREGYWGSAGVDSCTLSGCIVYGNTLITGESSDVYNSTATYSCFGSSVSGTGNIVADPLFVDAANGDYRLQSGSPCIDSGSNAGVTWQFLDVAGVHRKIGASVDMGCHEYSTHYAPTTLFVDGTTGDDTNDGLSWSSAKATIQNALNWSIDNDTILVADGRYVGMGNNGAVNNEDRSRRVTIQSVNGPEKTFIDGEGVRRCAKLSTSLDARTNQCVATLSGFTLTNGCHDTCSGVSHGVVENCVIAGCVSRKGTTSGSDDSGAASQCVLRNCLIRGNTSLNENGSNVAAGANKSELYNCTVVGNVAAAGTPAGGLYDCTAYNSIIVGNTVGGIAADVAECALTNCCLTSLQRGRGNIVAFPEFADEANGDFRLSLDSPCIDAGADEYAVGDSDLWGNPRIQGAHVDMGAYEAGSASWLRVEDMDVTYNGASNALAVTASFPGAEATLLYAISAEGPFTAETPAFLDAGTHTVWVTASAPGYPSVTNSATVTVRKKAVDSSMMCVIPDQVWDGTPKTPAVHIRDGWPDILGPENYTVEYLDNTDVGTAGVRITGRNNYEGSFVYPFAIEEPDDTRFLVIDLSGGTAAETYPVSSLGDVPAGGWTDEYKTTKLVLRKVREGSFWMGSPNEAIEHHVTLTRDFYVGVFETTQKQWELVMGTTPSDMVGETHPVEMVSYNMLRGASAGAAFPANNEVDASSFLGILRAKTGLDALDLPTEAQWEYACRAGTESALNSGKELETGNANSANLAEVGRYEGNKADETHTVVGSYLPNRWGLYDMHGNVCEWCLDWWDSNLGGGINPKGSSSGSSRVLRGGSWYRNASYCASSSLSEYVSPSSEFSNIGFRLFCAEPEPTDTVWYVDAEHGDDENTGRSWDEAVRTIQNAADRSVAGNTVVVTNGIYEPFTAMNLDIVIRSVEGAENTIIDGGGTNRCATLGSNTNDVVKTTLIGFTLKNGSVEAADGYGGGARGGILKRCLIKENHSAQYGGGLADSIVQNSIIVNNLADDDGGGAWMCVLADSLVGNNRADNCGGTLSGGGIYYSIAHRCTIVENQAVYGTSSQPGGAGADRSVLVSCILFGNTYTTGASSDVYECTATYSCFGTTVSGTGNIVADPLFVDAANGDYRLQAGSPCIDVGQLTNEAKMGTDLDGHSRWIGVGTDIGCYEWGTHYASTTQYVAQATGNDTNDGLSWNTAKATIQNAIDWAADGDEIVVADGIYMENAENACSIVNRKNAHLNIRSVNGPETAIIDGGGLRRCIQMAARDPSDPLTSFEYELRSNYGTIDGFTIRNGYTPSWGGAAAVAATLKNCILTGNVSHTSGVAHGSRLENCLIVGNESWNDSHEEISSSAATLSCLVNCTIVANTNMTSLGACAVAKSSVTNCIIVGNVVVNSPLANEVDEASCDVWYTCADTATAGTGNILVADPLFRDAANGDYRIRAVSPCVDAGDSASTAGETDLAGNSRVAHGAVDMGCYEYRPGVPVITPPDGTEFGKSTQTVMLTCDDPDATIYSTTDGSTPTAESPSRVKFSIRETTTVKAVAVVLGDWASEVATATIVRVYVVGAPDGLTAEEAAGGIALDWSAVDGAASYRVYRGPSPDIAAALLLGSTDGTAWTDATVEAGQAYYYFVVSENIAGVSEAGVPAIGTTLGLPTAVNMPRLVFTTSAGCPWTAESTAAAADGVHDANSGTPDDEAESWLETTVSGAGRITFQWRVSCEQDDSGERDWDHLVFLVDGVEKARIDGETGWTEAAFDVSGAGTHTLRWKYVKDIAMADGEDCGWLDCVDWRPTAALGDWEAWIDLHGLASPSGYEALKPMPSGKGDTLYDEFVAGLNPLDPLSRFLASIRMEADEPIVTPLPDLGSARTYRILGKRTLDPTEDWTDVTDIPDLDTAGYRFFKVTVQMKE